jgi:hypothetical protein
MPVRHRELPEQADVASVGGSIGTLQFVLLGAWSGSRVWSDRDISVSNVGAALSGYLPWGTEGNHGKYLSGEADDGMINEYRAIGGMRISRRNRNSRGKVAPIPLCLPQIPHDLTWNRTRATAVGTQRRTTWKLSTRWNLNSAAVSQIRL